jgi:hypothetical protein
MQRKIKDKLADLIDAFIKNEYGNMFYCCNPEELKTHRGSNKYNDGASWSVYVYHKESNSLNINIYSFETMSSIVKRNKIHLIGDKNTSIIEIA